MKRIIYILSTVALFSCAKIKPERITLTTVDTTSISETRLEVEELKQEIALRDSQIIDLSTKYKECLSGIKRTESKQTATNLILSLILSVLIFASITVIIKRKRN